MPSKNQSSPLSKRPLDRASFDSRSHSASDIVVASSSLSGGHDKDTRIESTSPAPFRPSEQASVRPPPCRHPEISEATRLSQSKSSSSSFKSQPGSGPGSEAPNATNSDDLTTIPSPTSQHGDQGTTFRLGARVKNLPSELQVMIFRLVGLLIPSHLLELLVDSSHSLDKIVKPILWENVVYLDMAALSKDGHMDFDLHVSPCLNHIRILCLGHEETPKIDDWTDNNYEKLFTCLKNIEPNKLDVVTFMSDTYLGHKGNDAFVGLHEAQPQIQKVLIPKSHRECPNLKDRASFDFWLRFERPLAKGGMFDLFGLESSDLTAACSFLEPGETLQSLGAFSDGYDEPNLKELLNGLGLEETLQPEFVYLYGVATVDASEMVDISRCKTLLLLNIPEPDNFLHGAGGRTSPLTRFIWVHTETSPYTCLRDSLLLPILSASSQLDVVIIHSCHGENIDGKELIDALPDTVRFLSVQIGQHPGRNSDSDEIFTVPALHRLQRLQRLVGLGFQADFISLALSQKEISPKVQKEIRRMISAIAKLPELRYLYLVTNSNEIKVGRWKAFSDESTVDRLANAIVKEIVVHCPWIEVLTIAHCRDSCGLAGHRIARHYKITAAEDAPLTKNLGNIRKLLAGQFGFGMSTILRKEGVHYEVAFGENGEWIPLTYL
ncbi:hypothetical protein BDV96DRAFT_602186 [Lophiotrema nucula]|uniref:Uncharacterized protein n=1 Tax=Lophiotrema nucula TaxID=690887 RepID=A0A6A5YZJ0_9PLEO|nr:hypothetical protein BDV96DRAFT_602186 [Lophiotrema nucula]